MNQQEDVLGTERIKKTVLSEHVKGILIENILSGKYKPGDRLVESTLAHTFGVSQSPVREAIKSLSEMGLVTVEPYKGTTIRQITDRDIWEVFTVRAALESMAAGLAAKRATPEDVAHLEEILQRMINTAMDNDAVSRMRINDEFHDLIMEIADHQYMIKLSKNLRFASWSHLKGSYYVTDPMHIAIRHQKIVDAIRDHDSARAEKLMREHIEENIPDLSLEE